MIYASFDLDQLCCFQAANAFFMILVFLQFVRSVIKVETLCIICCLLLDLDDPHLLLSWIWIFCTKNI
jgi:hypothetical protein